MVKTSGTKQEYTDNRPGSIAGSFASPLPASILSMKHVRLAEDDVATGEAASALLCRAFEIAPQSEQSEQVLVDYRTDAQHRVETGRKATLENIKTMTEAALHCEAALLSHETGTHVEFPSLDSFVEHALQQSEDVYKIPGLPHSLVTSALQHKLVEHWRRVNDKMLHHYHSYNTWQEFVKTENKYSEFASARSLTELLKLGYMIFVNDQVRLLNRLGESHDFLTHTTYGSISNSIIASGALDASRLNLSSQRVVFYEDRIYKAVTFIFDIKDLIGTVPLERAAAAVASENELTTFFPLDPRMARAIVPTERLVSHGEGFASEQGCSSVTLKDCMKLL